MKVAITGATGFIGRHVLAELQKRLVESIALIRPASKIKFDDIGCSLLEFDIQYSTTNAFELLGKPDVLIHLAWAGLPNYNSLHHFEQELPSQYRFLKCMIESGLKKLVVAGSCLEYGMQSGPLSEDLPVRPCNPYSFAKNALRCQLEFLKNTHPFQLAWARLFYQYGEGQAESSLLPKLRRAAEGGLDVFNMSGGEQLRDYLPVTSTAKYLVSLALTEKDIGVVNVCSGIPISVRKLVEGWIKENNWVIRINMGHYPYTDYEPMAFWGNSQKLLTLIGEDE